MLNNTQVIDKLNHLLGTVKDGETGYREAANEVENNQFQTMFNRYSQQRATLSSELQQKIRELGGEPDDTGSVGAAMHRLWMDIRESLSTRDDYAIIAEVERGEDVAIDNYQSVMDEALPSDVKSFVAQQYEQVKSAHDEVRDLKHQLKN